jgi:hypothetical protein
MGAKVAVDGEVQATPGSVLSTKTAAGSGSTSPAGTWSAGPITYTSYAKFKVGGEVVIWKASCKFSFSGTNTSGVTVTDDETVTLTATSKLTNKGQHHVLVHGDTETSPMYQNQLQVSAAGKYKTT